MSDDPSHLRIVARVPREGIRISDAEIDAALGSIDDADGPMLPTEKHIGPCRVCGSVEELTDEHVPPRGAFNKERSQELSLDDSLGRDDLTQPDGGAWSQGGISGYTLCKRCNNPRWTREYQDWAMVVAAVISRAYQLNGDLDQIVGYPGAADVTFKGRYPGRFVRQVISMFLSISGGPELAETYPDLRALVMGDTPRELPSPLRLYFQAYAGPTSRFVGGRGAIKANVETGEIQRLMAIDFPPMGFILLLEGPPLDQGLDISPFSMIDPDQKLDPTAEFLAIGFGHKPFPADYRTKATMMAERG